MEENEQSLVREIELVKHFARQDNYAEALRILDEIEETFPNEVRVLITRAYVNGRNGAREEAVANWTKAIALCDREPHYFYSRGIELFRLGRFRDAISDFTRVIELCDFYQSDYYRADAYFFRADAHLRLREIKQAKSDCEHLRDDMRTWTDRIRTKAEILEECGR